MQEEMASLTRRELLRAGGIGAAALAVSQSPGFLASAFAQTAARPVDVVGDPMGAGYWKARTDGAVSAHGSAGAVGGSRPTAGTTSALAAYPTDKGFWKLNFGGRVYAYGTATLTARPVDGARGRFIGLAAHPSGRGFWRVTTEGQVLASGVADRLGAPRTAATITGIAAHPDRAGYWILDARGVVHPFGAARSLGASAGYRAVAIAAHPSGAGYWVVRADGRVVAYGLAAHHGNGLAGVRVRGIAAHADGGGYWILHADGRVVARGSAAQGFAPPPEGPRPTVTSVGGIVVAESIAPRVRRLLARAREDGLRLGGWGYRSYDRQVELRQENCGPTYYDTYMAPSSACSPMTARPGSSMHEQGLAIDFYRIGANGEIFSIAGTGAFRWLARNAKDFGLYNLPAEPWHWSTNGR